MTKEKRKKDERRYMKDRKLIEEAQRNNRERKKIRENTFFNGKREAEGKL